MRYSGLKVIKEALTGHKGWKPVWRDPEPKPDYDIVIIGGGGHGLATAYYLAKIYREKRLLFWKRAGSAAAMLDGTRQSYGPIICLTATNHSMKCP
jgi:hypothetical protein